MAKYTVTIYTPQELSQSSYMQTGLFEMAHKGFIDVAVKINASKNLGRIIFNQTDGILETQQSFPKVSFYKLTNNSTKKSVTFATDLYDFSNQFSVAALEKCDYVFKRNYEHKYITKLSDKHQEKIHPFNLTFWVQSEYKSNDIKFFLGLLASNLNVNLKFDGYFFKRLIASYKAQLKHWSFIKTSRNLNRYEKQEKATKNSILFQTRCFLREDQQDVINIHEQRHHIIKLLRKHFSNQFLGGFIPSKIANEKYADALSNVPSEPELYLDALKKAKIVIYTRGLANSPAWKMAEYCSQGKIIIAERLTTELPVPLEHGKELLFFDTDEELVENIKLVLSDESLGNDLSVNARRYFEKHIHPAQSVKRILDIMITKLDN